MDRTSRIGVIVCFALLLYLWFFAMPQVPKPRPSVAPGTTALTSATANASAAQAVDASLAKPPPAPVAEQLSFLENDEVKATFTSRGAAIKEIELKKHKEGQSSNVVLNEQARSNVLQITGWPGADEMNFQVQQSPTTLTYTGTLANGVKWTRTYALNKDYVFTVKDTLSNPGATEITLPAYGLSVGRAEPLRVGGHYQDAANTYLGCGWMTTKSFYATTLSNFNPGSIPLVGIKTSKERDLFTSLDQDKQPLRWLAAENQFFAVLLTPDENHPITYAQFQCFNARDPDGRVPAHVEPDIEATAFFSGPVLPANGSLDYQYTLYAGPKEYDRLNALGDQQGELMNYGWFEPLVVLMLRVLHFFYSILGNYGVAIILLTLCIKAITWPLQSFANRSGKRMQAVAPKLKELQAKFKGQPEKLNTETFALYREYGVNPFGGCVPALVQMPVFFSLFRMLQNATELRGAKFLWVKDLTQPDTVLTWSMMGHHLALNPLPLMVTGLTVVMMRMTPQIGDPQQAKIAQFMPIIFLVIFYNFAAALSLYYVINNCVSIIQIYVNLRKPLPELTRRPKKKAVRA